MTCNCPDDCNCHHSYRTNHCGCAQHTTENGENMPDETTAIADALRTDGDMYTTADGTTYRLRLEPDDMSIMDEQGDGVWCGRLEYGERNRNTGWSQRPYDFTGRSEIVQRGDWRNDDLWWEVPADVVIGSDVHRTLRQTICDLLEYGYVTVCLERCAGTDAYGQAIVLDYSCLGGVESMADGDYLREIVGDLLSELHSNA